MAEYTVRNAKQEGLIETLEGRPFLPDMVTWQRTHVYVSDIC